MNEFQERLQDLLDEHNLKRAHLAKKIGISSTTINDYFNKNYYPQINIAYKMAKYFNCSLSYLLGLTDIKENTNTNQKSFIDNFDKLLQHNNLSISKSLKELCMGEYDYYRWKQGQFPKTRNLIEIAKYFDVSIDYLIGNITQ